MPLQYDDEPGSWEKLSEKWPYIDFETNEMAEIVYRWCITYLPYGTYVLLGTVIRFETMDWALLTHLRISHIVKMEPYKIRRAGVSENDETINQSMESALRESLQEERNANIDLATALLKIDLVISELVHENVLFIDSKTSSGFHEQSVGSLPVLLRSIRDIQKIIVNAVEIPEDEEHVCTYCQLKLRLREGASDKPKKEVEGEAGGS